MDEPFSPRTGEGRLAAVVGAGTIGTSWAALFLAHGFRVHVHDPGVQDADGVLPLVERAMAGLSGLAGAADWRARIALKPSLAEAVAGAWLVQENGPERLDVKRHIFAELGRFAPAQALLCSSSSGIPISQVQDACAHPGRCIVAHPFNPPHLVPLVEVVPGRSTSEATVEACMALYASLGKMPVRLHKEVPGFIANRLQAALWREAVSLVEQDVASVADIDKVVAYGVGLRWALMGPHMSLHLGGGEGGMAHLLDILGGAFQGWMEDMRMPSLLDPRTRQRLVEGVAQEADGAGVAELARERDRLLASLVELVRTKRVLP